MVVFVKNSSEIYEGDEDVRVMEVYSVKALIVLVILGVISQELSKNKKDLNI